MIKVGLDYYVTKSSLDYLLTIAYKYDIAIYHVRNKKNCICFYGKIKDRKKIKANIDGVQYKYTTGLFGIIHRIIFDYSRLLPVLLAILFIYVLNNLTYNIQIYGDSDILDEEIMSISDKYKYTFVDESKLKQEIKDLYNEQVSFLEVYKTGNNIEIKYKVKDEINETQHNDSALIAKKDGLIANFEVSSGYKEKQINEIVKKGEIIVNNEMLDSNNQIKSISVSGKVYAYTWNKVVVEIDELEGNEVYAFCLLLFEARNQIHLEEDEYIVKENILQFYTSNGKMCIEVLFTVYEDITS